MTITRSALPLRASGTWRCGCGGTAVLADYYTIFNGFTGEEIQIRRPHEEIAVSAITLAELLRLGQAAKAVQEGRPGADDRLDRLLAEAPAPIRRLRERMGPAEWIALAALILSLVQVVTGIVKDDGHVTEKQLVEVIERLVDDQETSQEQ